VSAQLVNLGGSSLDKETNALLVQCQGAPIDEDGTAPDFGSVPIMCALGLTARPYQATDDGSAQALIVDVAGFQGVVVGARDTRSAKIVGKLDPGDTVVHSTGKEQAAQLQLKELKRMAALLSKTTGGKTMAVILDGTKDKLQVTHAGAIIEIDKGGDISIVNGGGAGLLLQGSNVHVLGNLVAGKGNPPLCFALCTPAGYPLGGIVACQGVTPGT